VTSPSDTTISVDIWSDIACPWCYIGKRRFEAGLARFDGRDDVVVTLHSFELAPDTPTDFDGSEVDFLVRHKGIGSSQVAEMLQQVTQIAAGEGLRYDFDALRHTNTRKAHEVLHLARAHGRQLDMAERLFAAYFTEGRHLGRDDDLATLAGDVGLDADEVRSALSAGTYAAAVDADIAQARAFGISAVPFFVIDGRYGISGAQPADAFASALIQVGAELGGAAPEG
jgi:predicted DsbA family dithiol-disulfide isomerase